MLLGTLFLFLLSHTLAHPVSLPPENPTSPESPVLNAFVAISDCIRDPSKIRSTSELLWNCLGTIFVCTYVAIHPNMPDRDATKGERMWQKVTTCLYALLAPEVVIMMAMQQRFAASRIAKQYKDYGWTITHGFFVTMGGLMREDENGYKVVIMGADGHITLGKSKEKVEVMLPTILEDEIMDKAKGDFLTKLVVVIQTSWFLVQCIARHAQGLVVTELELVTLAFATLNIITYFLWWSKPLNAEFPIYFKKDGGRSSGPMKIKKDNFGLSDMYSGVWIGWTWEENPPKESIWQRIKNDVGRKTLIHLVCKWLVFKPFTLIFSPLFNMMGSVGFVVKISADTYVDPYYSGPPLGASPTWIFMSLLSALIGILFGGIHLIGYNYRFSTYTECLLWRISSIIVTVEPPILAAVPILEFLRYRYPKFDVLIATLHTFADILAAIIGLILYTAARITLLVLPLLALRNLPPSAHQNVQWSDYIPHI
ncbi:hypothetical protein AX16_008445 [Volvariella volvacea WC 439]|nr:hypothetical protein AX16_008445 [Volvariella volvacea WC 439]